MLAATITKSDGRRADGRGLMGMGLLDVAIGAFPQPTAPPTPNFFRHRRSEVIRRRPRFSGVMLDHPHHLRHVTGEEHQ
jgi:hypothetical protein